MGRCTFCQLTKHFRKDSTGELDGVDLYSKATSVAIWLGPDPHNDTKDMFEGIEALIELLGAICNMRGEFNCFDNSTGDLH